LDKDNIQLLDQFILQIIKENRPGTVNELVKLAQAEYLMPEKDILERVLHLKKQGKIVFKTHSSLPSLALRQYLFSSESRDYWTIIALSLATVASVIIVPDNAYPIVYVRNVLGSIFVLLLPGYSFIKALFPARELDYLERIALSIGISFALVSISGLVLYYTQYGIKTTPITLSLLALTATFATTAVIREHKAKVQEYTQQLRKG